MNDGNMPFDLSWTDRRSLSMSKTDFTDILFCPQTERAHSVWRLRFVGSQSNVAELFHSVLKNQAADLGIYLSKRQRAHILLFHCAIEGFGTEKDGVAAAAALTKAADLGAVDAQAIVMRIHNALQLSLPKEIPLREWLSAGVIAGSSIAEDDLYRLDRETYEKALRFRTSRAAYFNCEDNSGFISNKSSIQPIPSTDVCDMGSQLGDTALHWAVSCGESEALIQALQDSTYEINTANNIGEPALYQASRNGCIETATLLLSRGQIPTSVLEQRNCPYIGSRHLTRLWFKMYNSASWH